MKGNANLLIYKSIENHQSANGDNRHSSQPQIPKSDRRNFMPKSGPISHSEHDKVFPLPYNQFQVSLATKKQIFYWMF